MSYASNTDMHDRRLFEHGAEELQAWVNSFLAATNWDVNVRNEYQTSIRAAVGKMRDRALLGEITWQAAAEQLQQTRNDLMQLMRTKSSPIGLAVAEFLKKEGKTLNDLIGRYAVKRHGKDVEFDLLSQAQKDAIYADIVDAAARSNVSVDAVVWRIGWLSRRVVVLSIAISVYEIATSPDPGQTAGREAVLTGAGIGGSVAAGALAGLVCGPGAPVCVTAGAFVGGALAVLGAGMMWK